MEKLFDCITRDFRLAINSVLEPRQAATSQVALSILATIKWTRLADFAARGRRRRREEEQQQGRKTLDDEKL